MFSLKEEKENNLYLICKERFFFCYIFTAFITLGKIKVILYERQLDTQAFSG